MLKNTNQILSQSQIERVHELSLDILANKGYIFHSQEARDILCAQGARQEEQFTKIPHALMEKLLSHCPKTFEWKGRNQSILVGEKQDECYACQNHGPVAIHTADGARRNGTLKDLADFYKLGQSGIYSKIVGQVSIDPSDVPENIKDMLIARELLRHTDKPMMSYPMPAQKAEQVFDMFKLILGEKDFYNNTFICASVCSLSPLQYSEESLESLIFYAKNKQALMFMSGPMLGLTSPLNFMQTLVQTNVENLAGIALAQAITPELPVIYGAFATISNMYNGVSLVSDPDTIRINKAALEVVQTMYNIPTRCITTTTDAKCLDVQAGYEAMQNKLPMILGGCNLINECFGVVDAMLGISFEKYIIDEEIFSRCLHIAKPLSVREEDFNMDDLFRVDELTSFLMDEKTLFACQDLWKPVLSERNDYDAWQNQGQQTVVKKAQNILQERLQSSAPSLLSKDEENMLNKFIENNS